MPADPPDDAPEPIALPDHVWQYPTVRRLCETRDAAGLLRLIRDQCDVTPARMAYWSKIADTDLRKIINRRPGKTGRPTGVGYVRWQRIADGLNMPDPNRLLLGLPPAQRQAHLSEPAPSSPSSRSTSDSPLWTRTARPDHGHPPDRSRPIAADVHSVTTLDGPMNTGLDGHSPDDEQRLTMATQRRTRPDLTVVDSLATILAAQRRLDDSLGPDAILPATAAQAASVVALMRDARGAVRDALGPIASEWVQFHGWLHAELRNDRTAIHLLTDAEDLADEIEDGPLAAQAANFKGYLSRQQGHPRGVVRHFLTAYHTPGAHPAQRIGDALQAAHGYALLGEARTARQLLDEATALADKAAHELPPDTAYWLTPDFQHVNMGLALAALGEHAAAAQHLAAGLESLPADQQNAEWTREYRDALDRAREYAAGG